MPKDNRDPNIPEDVRKAALGAIDGPYRPTMIPINQADLAEEPMKRPAGSNADEWQLFLSFWLDVQSSRGLAYVAVQIAEALAAAEARAQKAEEVEQRWVEQMSNKWKTAEIANVALRAANARLETALRDAIDHVAKGRIGSFGTWQGYSPQIDVRRVEEWRVSLAAPAERQPARRSGEDGDE